MEKVKLTKEQAEAIEYALQEVDEYKGNPDRLLRHASMKNVYFRNELHLLNSIDTVNLAKALYIGYEVEPEFKARDWVKHKKDNVIGKVVILNDGSGRIQLDNDGCFTFDKHELRYATPEEIQQEKERRWWAKHGREVWELKRGDILSFHESLEVYNIEEAGHNFIFVNGANGKVRYELEQVKKLLKIACFAEDRKDI